MSARLDHIVSLLNQVTMAEARSAWREFFKGLPTAGRGPIGFKRCRRHRNVRAQYRLCTAIRKRDGTIVAGIDRGLCAQCRRNATRAWGGRLQRLKLNQNAVFKRVDFGRCYGSVSRVSGAPPPLHDDERLRNTGGQDE